MPVGFHLGKKNDGTARMYSIPFWLWLVIISVLGILAAIFVPATKGGASGM